MASSNIPLPIDIEVNPLKNSQIISLYHKSCKYTGNGLYKVLHQWICQLGNVPEEHVNMNTLLSSVQVVCNNYMSMNKKKSLDINDFEDQLYQIPRKLKSNMLKRKNVEHDIENENDKIKSEMKEIKKRRIIETRKLKRRNITIDNLKKKYSYIKDLNKKKLIKPIQRDSGVQCNIVNEEMKALKSKHKQFENEINILKENQEVKLDIITRDHSRGLPYSTAIRQVCYDYLSKNVSSKNIPDLVVSTINHLTKYKISKDELPSPKIINTMNLEISNVCKQQLTEVISSKNNLTILRDGTTKKGKQFYGVKLSSKTETLTLGVTQVSRSNADTLFKCTKEMFEEVENAGVNNDNKMNIIGTISNCMTDRCPTELKVNKLLKETKCLEKKQNVGAENQEDETSEDVIQFDDINEYQCSVHPLLQFSSECVKVLKKTEKEKNISLKFLGLKGESVCHLFIRSITKLFFKDGTGDPALITAYMKRYVSNIPLVNFKGN